jgi:hypothetical protein
MEAGLRVLAAAGGVMLGTLQNGAREATRFEPQRDEAGNIADAASFEAYLARVRKIGAGQLHPTAPYLITCSFAFEAYLARMRKIGGEQLHPQCAITVLHAHPACRACASLVPPRKTTVRVAWWTGT